MSDEYFMKEALKEAENAFALGEVPVGAVLVCENEIIARAHNRVEMWQDATAHAEVLVLKEGAKHLGNWRLSKTILYCSLEPCAMCAGAMLLSRISTLVWGAKDVRCGAHGSWVNLLDASHPIHSIEVRSGVLHEEAAALMKAFFRQRRIENGTVR